MKRLVQDFKTGEIKVVDDPAGVAERLAARRVYLSNKDAVPQLKGYRHVMAGARAQAGQFLHVVESLHPPLLPASMAAKQEL